MNKQWACGWGFSLVTLLVFLMSSCHPVATAATSSLALVVSITPVLANGQMTALWL